MIFQHNLIRSALENKLSLTSSNSYLRIRSTNNILSKIMINHPQVSYCKPLDLVAYYQNNSPIMGMSMTLTEIMYGIKPRLTLSNIISSELTTKFIDRNNDINEHLNSYALIRRCANDEHEIYRMSQNDKKKERYETLKEGETFYLKKPRQHKFDQNYTQHKVFKDLRTKVLYKNKGKELVASKSKIKKF